MKHGNFRLDDEIFSIWKIKAKTKFSSKSWKFENELD